MARIMNGLDGFRKALRIGPSPNHGLTFCVGTWGQMGGVSFTTRWRNSSVRIGSSTFMSATSRARFPILQSALSTRETSTSSAS
ncbi:hypothetical protein CHELA1G11_14666 [Hyphomicrobiales bacterium]|nr:hypothetical protein CHELA1G2_14441 [Hyphomicrobiales bacterium]CAH1680164.1 hypothetical protein CHELA1G11_14666 [Hyphomicrobiales bacterium]